MRALLLMSLCAFLAGCGESHEVTTPDGYVVKTIDSCEYIEVDEGLVNTRVYSLTHKGNCKYCAKRRADEIGKP